MNKWVKLNAIGVNNKKHYDKYLNAILPDVILDITSVSVIPVNEARPNCTSKKVEGEDLLILNLKQMKTLWTRLL